MNEISTQLLRAHIYELAGKIGEHNIFHPDALRAAEAYIMEEWQQQGYAVHKQTYTVQGIDCANLEITCTGTCPNCGAHIKLKTMERRYVVLLLFLVLIFASIVYLYHNNVTTTSSTSLGSSQPKSAGAIEKIDEAKKVEAESLENVEADAAAQAKVGAQKAKAATQRVEAEQAKLAIKQKVNRNWIRPVSTTTGLKCTIRVRLLSDGTVMDAEIISSSGDEDFDRSAENAVNKASPLPVPKDKELFAREFRSFQFLFNPK